ncbi:nicotinate-nucleotide adenylyltransferase [Motiliproteus coralliicola]|nr:nicotinate-nucleotide adenylyltransferase [Motiliproteus coralliicola]
MTDISANNSPEQVSPSRSVAMLGGTFDPVHHGHLRMALELRDRLGFAQVRLVPCALPVHRESPGCSAEQRLAMVQLAAEEEVDLLIDDRELRSNRPSYSYDTLSSLRAELGDEVSLTMVIGTDSLRSLDSWYRWQELLGLCHILVIARPGWHLEPEHPVARWLLPYQAESVDQLHATPCGSVLLLTLAGLEISASEIRRQIGIGHSPRYLLPDSVWNHIRQQQLYRKVESKPNPELPTADSITEK